MMNMKKNSVAIMRGKHVGNFYKLLGNTVSGGATILDSYIWESFIFTKDCEVLIDKKNENWSSKLSKRKLDSMDIWIRFMSTTFDPGTVAPTSKGCEVGYQRVVMDMKNLSQVEIIRFYWLEFKEK